MIGETWIGEFARWLGRFVPRIHHLECTNIGVLITRGSKIRVMSPRMWLYWPVWTTLYWRPGNIQTADLPTQALTTLDQKIVVVGGMLRYEFDRSKDAVKRALVDTDDVEAALVDEALAVFCAHITSLPLEKLQQERTATNRSLTGKLGTALAVYGVKVLRAQLTDFSPCVTLNHVGFLKQTETEEF